MRPLWFWLTVTAFAAGGSAAPAQEPPADSGAVLRPCRGRADGRACGLRFEPRFGAYVGGRLSDEIATRVRIGFGGDLTHSVGRRAALGASVWLMAHGGTSASAFLKYRHWLGQGFVLDAAIGSYLGSVLEGEIGNYPMRFPSPIADLGVGYRDWLGIHVRFESLAIDGTEPLNPDDPSGQTAPADWQNNALLIGAQVGRGLGWLGWLASAVVIGIAAATCC